MISEKIIRGKGEINNTVKLSSNVQLSKKDGLVKKNNHSMSTNR